MNLHIPIPQLTEKQLRNFNVKIYKNSNLTECWLWIGGLMNKGYGIFRLNNQMFLTNRIAYFLDTEIDPGELNALHTCDIRRCVNPKHLFLGDNFDNVHDCMIKGRRAIHLGKTHGRVKLKEYEVIEIRRLRNETSMTFKEIGNQFGVKPQTIYKICLGETWKHI